MYAYIINICIYIYVYYYIYIYIYIYTLLLLGGGRCKLGGDIYREEEKKNRRQSPNILNKAPTYYTKVATIINDR